MKRKASVSYDEAILRRVRKDPDFAAEYLKAALEDEDEPRVLLIALHHLAQAQGIAKVAKAAGIERESLYRALSVQGKLTHSSNLKVFENAIEILDIVRPSDEDDSRADKVRAVLRMVYGGEEDGATSYGLRHPFFALSKLSPAAQEKKNTDDSVNPAEFIRKAIGKEMLRLAKLYDAAASVEKQFSQKPLKMELCYGKTDPFASTRSLFCCIPRRHHLASRGALSTPTSYSSKCLVGFHVVGKRISR